jgi:hypothetical protein
LNYQQPEYVANNELICFGLSTADVEEQQPTWTPKALHDLDIVICSFNRAVEKLVQEGENG